MRLFECRKHITSLGVYILSLPRALFIPPSGWFTLHPLPRGRGRGEGFINFKKVTPSLEFLNSRAKSNNKFYALSLRNSFSSLERVTVCKINSGKLQLYSQLIRKEKS